MDSFSTFLQQFITFFAILDPIGVSAIALSLFNKNITKTQISQIAFKTTFTIIIAFFVVIVTGDFILKLFGIDENSLKVMGGIVLILMAISMVTGSVTKKEEDNKESEAEDISIIPLGIPIAFGTGLFTTIIIFKHQAQTVFDIFSISMAFCLNALVFYLILRNSVYIKKYLGMTGQNIITKLMGLIVGAIAVQFIVGGVVMLSKGYLGA